MSQMDAPTALPFSFAMDWPNLMFRCNHCSYVCSFFTKDLGEALPALQRHHDSAHGNPQAAQPDTAEPAYRCGQCGASGCRLFRPYQTFCVPGALRCAACAAASEGIDDADLSADQIGWYVRAVPTTPRYDSFWGYTSVPGEPLAWWRSLPVKPTTTGGAS